jgi:multimeric flavodoxin WrbA
MLETGRSKVVVLDGGPGDDGAFARTRAVLLEVLNQDRAAVQIFSLSSMKLAHCIGCFGCWTETRRGA